MIALAAMTPAQHQAMPHRMNIPLQAVLHSQEGWGQRQGREVRTRIENLMTSSVQIIAVSLAGITHTDVAFARASIVELAACQRTRRGFCLEDVTDADILDNWDAATSKLEHPLTVWFPDGSYRVLGPQPSTGLRQMLGYVFSVPVARTSEAAAEFQLKVPNVSNKLKQLWQGGYILRQEQSASSGGVQYDYIRIG